MPSVQSVGSVDYSQSYQPVQYEEINSTPAVYSETPKKKSSGAGPLILTLIALTAAGWVGHGIGKKGVKKELEKLQNSEAVKNYDSLKETFEGLKDAANEIERDAADVIDKRFGGFKHGKDFARKVKEKFTTPFKEQAEKLDKSIKEAAEEAGEIIEETASEAAEAIAK